MSPEAKLPRSSLHRQVSASDTAEAVGSGSLAVLGTPILIAWCEAATVDAVAGVLADGTTTVGTRIEISHLKPSIVGSVVEITAQVTQIDGRLYTFEVSAESGGEQIAAGQITRAAVNADRFMTSANGL